MPALQTHRARYSLLTFCQPGEAPLNVLLARNGVTEVDGVTIMDSLGTWVKHAEMMIIPEAGHSAYWEQPEPFSRAVLEFFRKHN